MSNLLSFSHRLRQALD